LIIDTVCIKLFLMPKKSRFFSGGFVDPLSLFGLAFMIITLFAATAVNQKSANFDIREKAATCTTNQIKCEGSGQLYSCVSGTWILDVKCGSKVCNSAGTGCGTPAPTKSPAPTAIPTYTCTQTSGQYCSKDCSYSSGSGTCASGTVCCKTAPAPTKSPVPTPIPTYTCTQTSGQYCSKDCSYSSGSGTCASGTVCCKTAPAPTPSPTSNPNIQCSAGQIKCEGSGQLYSCYSGSWILDVKCATANCNSTGTTCGTSTSNMITTYTCTQTSGQYCNKDCPYDLGSGTCQSGQVCCKPVDQSLACSTQGQVKCMSGQLYNCSSGYWYPGANCESKSCNTTGTACTPLASCVATNGLGATRCKVTSTASYVETCSSSGTWTLGLACTGSCSNGLCSDCATKPNVCNNTGGINYCLNGTYYSKSCLTGTVCSGGTCVPANCANKPNVCNDAGGVNYCLNGSYTSIKCATGATCSGGECISCNTRDMCLAVGQSCCPGLDKVRWTGCTSGLKCGSCLAGQTRCGGTGTSAYSEVCQNDTTWAKSPPCQFGCSDLSGKCLAAPQKDIGIACTANTECASGYCYAKAGVGQINKLPSCQELSPEKYLLTGAGAVVLTGGAVVASTLINPATVSLSLKILELISGPTAVYICQTQGSESEACINAGMGLVNSYLANPAAFITSLNESAQTVTGAAKTGIMNLISKLQSSSNLGSTTSSVLYDIYNVNPLETYSQYLDSYGPLPNTLNTGPIPEDVLFNFQQTLIDNPTSSGISDALAYLESRGINITVLNAQQMEELYGLNTGSVCVMNTCGLFNQTKTFELVLSDLTGYQQIYGLNSQEEAILMAAQKVGHEGGHVLDTINLGVTNDWASELRQVLFNQQFYAKNGQSELAAQYQELANLIRSRYRP
jgi:hypothetical protein